VQLPRVFIASSTEGLLIAQATFARLKGRAEPQLWTNQLFLPGAYPLEVLDQQVRRHDFAVVVASPDDQIIKRGVVSAAMRDNLLLEFGLFTGALGLGRTFFLCPSAPRVELPSDLLGILNATYDASKIISNPDDAATAVAEPCQQITAAIGQQWEAAQVKRAEVTLELHRSQKGQSIRRLHHVAVQLRDTLAVLQRDSLAALTNEGLFQESRKAASSKVIEIADSFRGEAQVVGVQQELQALCEATTTALLALPFPQEIALGKDAAKEKAINVGLGAVSAFLGGRDPLRHVEDKARGEAGSRISSLKERYTDWWQHHSPGIQQATVALQDALFRAAMELAMLH
jgi:hypothetical protein